MADTANASSSGIPDTDAPTKKPRGRPSGATSAAKVEKKPETPQQRIAQLKAELEKAQEALREFEAKRASIVGRVVVAHALAHPDYRKQLADLLRREVTSKGDLAVIAELLP